MSQHQSLSTGLLKIPNRRAHHASGETPSVGLLRAGSGFLPGQARTGLCTTCGRA